jgi:UDP-N-acetylglucosamine 3-dehydrogenase
MQALRVGVIGLGAFGESHLRAFRGIPGVDVTAVVSRRPERAQQIAADFSIEKWYADFQELCNDPEIDAVTICTEESGHVAPAVTALAAGKHVLVEKPLATTTADALAILTAAKASHGVLMPAHIVRFEARFAALKQAVAAGSLGRIAALHARRNRPRNTLATYGRCHPALVTAIHDLDIMLWLMDELPERVWATHRLEREPDGVYGIWGRLAFPSGAIATIEATWMMPAETGLDNGDSFAVTGTRGTATIEMANSGFRILQPGKTLTPDVGYEPVIHGSIAGALQNELQHFVRLAQTPRMQPIVAPNDGVRAVITAEALIAAATNDKEIAIDWPNAVR